MNTTEVTDCSGGDCLAVTSVGTDWFQLWSTAHGRAKIAVTGHELRAFIRQVRAGQFDLIAGLAPDTTVSELLTERDALLARIAELEHAAEMPVPARVVA